MNKKTQNFASNQGMNKFQSLIIAHSKAVNWVTRLLHLIIHKHGKAEIEHIILQERQSLQLNPPKNYFLGKYNIEQIDKASITGQSVSISGDGKYLVYSGWEQILKYLNLMNIRSLRRSNISVIVSRHNSQVILQNFMLVVIFIQKIFNQFWVLMLNRISKKSFNRKQLSNNNSGKQVFDRWGCQHLKNQN
ncbi:hypothetical protein pb186bvf_020935 [Paramecium bursaria]